MKTTTKRKLFFSGEAGETLQQFCQQHAIELTSKSLISFKAVLFEIRHPFDVVFISSKRSFNYFISQVKNYQSFDYAVIGQETANYLNDLISSIKFIGEYSGKPEQVGQDFSNWLGDRRVLFPVSLRSQKTVASAVPDTQKEIVYCYDTLLVREVVEQHDLYVFTSPSNVEAFLLENAFPADCTIVAWGTTTAKYMRSRGVEPSITLERSSEAELVEVLQNRLSP